MGKTTFKELSKIAYSPPDGQPVTESHIVAVAVKKTEDEKYVECLMFWMKQF